MVGRKPVTLRPAVARRGTPNKFDSVPCSRNRGLGAYTSEYMLKILRDEKIDASRRDEMAKAAAPYCHSRLRTVDAKLNINQSLADALDEMEGWG